MTKLATELRPSHAPVYAAALYPDLCKIFQQCGYALAVHGSLARDFDLIAVPWADSVSAPADVLAIIESTFSAVVVGDKAMKNHGRIAYTVAIGFGCCGLDLSFLPTNEREASHD
jgi:hypothetical protein